MTIWGEFKFYFLKNDHFGPFFGQIWPPNTPKSPKFRKSALTRLKHTCLWTLWRWWQVSGTSGIFRHLDFHEKSLNLVKLHRVPPVKFFFEIFLNIFFIFSKIIQKTLNKVMPVNLRFRSGFLGLKSKWPIFTPQGAVCTSGGPYQPHDCTETRNGFDYEPR